MVLSVEKGADGVLFVRFGTHKLRLDLEDLDDEYRERSRKELRETPQVREDALVALKKMLKDEEGLNIPIDDDNFLIKFLRPCKFYPESTFKLMKRYYKFKQRNAKLLGLLLPSELKHVLSDGLISFLPVRDDNGCRFMIINIGSKWNTKKCSLQDILRTLMLALEVAMYEPRTQVGGVHVFLDFQGLSLTHICQFTPGFARIFLEWVQECTPVRLKGIHVVNQPYIFNMLYAMFKPFMMEKLRKRIHMHGMNRESLHQFIDPKFLPPWYGGNLDIPEMPGYLLADIMCNYEKEFELCSTYGYTTEKVRAED